MREQVLRELYRDKVVAIVRGLGRDSILDLAEALLEGGVRFMEVTFRQDAPETWRDTADAIACVAEKYRGDMRVGAGTVMTLEQLALAHDAGAQYIISPNADEGVIRQTRARGLVSLPGAFTATEIANAHAWGADIVKVFPAGRLGPGYIRDLRAPLAHIPLMAVGGVNAENAGDFIAAGAMGVGVGGSLVKREWIDAGAFAKITDLARAYVRAVNPEG